VHLFLPCPAHLITSNLTSITVLDEYYKLWIVLHSFLHFIVASSVFGLDILFFSSSLYFKTLSIFYQSDKPTFRLFWNYRWRYPGNLSNGCLELAWS
jgi:hypothetical protein